MSYLLKSKPKKNFSYRFIFSIVLFLFLFSLIFFFKDGVRSISYSIAKPFWVVADYSLKPFSSITYYFKTKNAIIEENLYLRDEIQILRLKSIDYDILMKQTDDLKSQLGRINTSGKKIVRIFSKPPLSPYDTFIVDAGENAGLVVGSKVFISDNIVIGVVKNVSSNTSLISIFSSSGEENEAILQRTGSTFKLVGQGGGNFKIEVPKETDIVWGDSFVYPNLSSSVMANVYYIDSNAESSFKIVYLRTPVNVFSSKYLFVESI